MAKTNCPLASPPARARRETWAMWWSSRPSDWRGFFLVRGKGRAVAGMYSMITLNRRACDMSTAPLATALTCLRRAAEGRSDRQLLEAYAATNDQTAFAALVRRH